MITFTFRECARSRIPDASSAFLGTTTRTEAPPFIKSSQSLFCDFSFSFLFNRASTSNPSSFARIFIISISYGQRLASPTPNEIPTFSFAAFSEQPHKNTDINQQTKTRARLERFISGPPKMCWKPFLAHTAIHRNSKANTNQNQVNKHHVPHHIILPQDFKTHSEKTTPKTNCSN